MPITASDNMDLRPSYVFPCSIWFSISTCTTDDLMISHVLCGFSWLHGLQIHKWCFVASLITDINTTKVGSYRYQHRLCWQQRPHISTLSPMEALIISINMDFIASTEEYESAFYRTINNLGFVVV